MSEVLEGSLPPQFRWLSEPDRWLNLQLEHPKLFRVLPHFVSVLEQIFVRTFEIPTQRLAVYGLGRICVEDFLEIMLLAENGFEIGALKSVRGLYERAVIAEIIAADEGQARLFCDFYDIASAKAQNRANDVYSGQWSACTLGEVRQRYEEVKDKYPRKTSWTPLSLDQLADKVAEIIAKRHNEDKNPSLKDLYLLAAELPNAHIHASMFSIVSRLRQEDSRVTFRIKSKYEDLGISTAHTVMTLVAYTQNHFFELGLNAELQKFNADCKTVWQTPD